MELVIIIIILAVFIYGIYKLAKSKNRDPGGWILASIIISPIIILIILAIMPKLPENKIRKIKRKKIIKKNK